MSAVVAVVLAMFISKLSSDKITHVHVYVTTILCVIFWIKSNIKISNFLTVCLEVIKDKIKAWNPNNVWDLVHVPKGAKTGCNGSIKQQMTHKGMLR
jgi:hypothetical protein